MAAMLAICSFGWASPASAEAPPVDLSFNYVSDVSATVSGGADGKVRYADNAEVALDADLGALLGLADTTVHIDVLGNFGARPNDAAGSLEGVDNIEVGRSAVRLFEAWVEHSFGDTSVRLGLYDLNSEFYATEASGLLIAPPFGIGSELAATGSNGPSIFPSTALGLRLRTGLPGPKAYAQVAVLNARAQTFGDPGGVDLGFDEGLLVIGEAGAGDRFHGALGAWTYTRHSDALASLDPDGEPLRARTWGIYGVAEYHFTRGGKRDVVGFLRGGMAQGRSNLFANSLQAGLLVTPAFVGRDASAFSLGYRRATTSAEYRAAQALAGETPWRMEQALEVTYSDELTSFATLQPDLQLIHKTDRAGTSQTGLQATLRMSISF